MSDTSQHLCKHTKLSFYKWDGPELEWDGDTLGKDTVTREAIYVCDDCGKRFTKFVRIR